MTSKDIKIAIDKRVFEMHSLVVMAAFKELQRQHHHDNGKISKFSDQICHCNHCVKLRTYVNNKLLLRKKIKYFYWDNCERMYETRSDYFWDMTQKYKQQIKEFKHQKDLTKEEVLF